jgi:hypothetical protein
MPRSQAARLRRLSGDGQAVPRTAAARTHETLAAAIWAALTAITPADARGYFTRCGYPPRLNTHERRCE